MGLLPFIDTLDFELQSEDTLPEAKEYAWDTKTWQFLTQGGRMYFVYQDEAIKLWLWKLFMTPRYSEVIFTWDYGHELESLFGKGFSNIYIQSEARRLVTEAIDYSLSDYIKQINEFNIEFNDGQLKLFLNVDTIYNKGVDMFV